MQTDRITLLPNLPLLVTIFIRKLSFLVFAGCNFTQKQPYFNNEGCLALKSLICFRSDRRTGQRESRLDRGSTHHQSGESSSHGVQQTIQVSRNHNSSKKGKYDTFKLGNNDYGYNKIMAIPNKYGWPSAVGYN